MAPRQERERRVAVVTGASAGIGRAIARAFAQQGWCVALLARGEDGLEGAREDVERLGAEALAIPTDVADQAQVEAAAAQVEAQWGAIDVWVNNAMATIFSDLLAITPEDFRRATEVTYLGAVWGTMSALKRMKARNAGVIVQVGSALAYRSIPLQAPYCGAKAALRGFTDSLRCELAHDASRVRVTMVHLSAFNTPQFEWGRTTLPRRPRPMGTIFQPEIAARAVVWAATHRRRELWVGWPAVQAILGTRVVPGLLDRVLGASAVDGQQTDEPLPRERPDNLWKPVAGDHGAHGRFDDEARTSSAQFWLDTHRGALAAGALALLFAASRAFARRRE
ncbi:SDR family oxidoreductase [Variovorax soli]|uniref:NAD(P)-dependent dehydrogenase (Short-subunit alcohol dehydrogenase family) n=1 Tax=Variovorax soli TaxID=376815 RepID=A0ABU1NDJ7_9BURK|nr:SDR family oxidoreductase [Variovorax soli]MDR6536532.1 NAD(P)-dependent dehydrogenase (short-subunit alcohol dehydrogenase family) [Variovorax soli]